MKALEVNNLTKSFVKYNSRFDLLLYLTLGIDNADYRPIIDDVSFTVNKGETFGILGDNASGKTVILKLLANQLHASSGEIIADGKIMRHAYMTGFLDTKTGYENIYYKCGLHGMREFEVDAIIGDIINFSELGDAIHDKYNSYSTSMRSKLGFAISIYVKADIVLMDESFAVGDGRFRKKCNDAFYKLRRSGLTVVYASYSPHSIKNSCDRAMWIDKGQVVCIGNPQKLARLYEMVLSHEKTIEEVKHGLEVGLYAVH